MQKPQHFHTQADKPVEPRLLEARLKLFGQTELERGKSRKTGQSGARKVSRILETFEALCCLIRKVDKRTLNAKSAFHLAA